MPTGYKKGEDPKKRIIKDMFSVRHMRRNLPREQQLLGSFLHELSDIESVNDTLCAMDFHCVAHRRIFAALVYLSRKNMDPTQRNLELEMDDNGWFDETGDMGYLAQLKERGKQLSLTRIHSLANEIIKNSDSIEPYYAV